MPKLWNVLMLIVFSWIMIDRFYDEKGFVYEREGRQWYKYENFEEYSHSNPEANK